MPFIDIKVIQRCSPRGETRAGRAGLKTVIAVEGEALRQYTVTAITETPSGEWAVGGQTFTAEDVKAVRSAAAVV